MEIPNPRRAILALILMIIASMSACAPRRPVSNVMTPACEELARNVAQQESEFVSRVKEIRGQHLLLQEYDRRMIAVIIDRRAILQATTLTEMSVTEEVAGCSGKPLDDLRRHAQQQMTNLRVFLNTFKRALKYDPDNVFIDEL